MVRMMRNGWLLAVFASSGCAVFASASVKHSHSGCVDDKSFAAIDFITTAGTGGVLIATGVAVDQPVSLVLPAVFLASGILGLVEVATCRGPSRPRKRASGNYVAAPVAAPVVAAPLPLPSHGEPAVPPPLPVLLRVTRDPRPTSAQPTLPAPVEPAPVVPAPVEPAPPTPPAPSTAR